MGMYFPPSEYKKKIKISTRCFIDDCLQTLKNLKPPLNDKERGWFEKHPQFRHIFHMPRVNNHKVMGMWMLLLRTVRIEREKEAWFAVNGVPIRYGLREHALISGLNCQNYPLNFMEKGGLKLVNKYFGDGATIRYQDVKAKLEEMEPSTDRLKMAVLYLLSSIIIGQTKMGKDAPAVEPFFLRAVDDLKLCKTFPWGRLSFDNMLKEISHTMDHFGGDVKEGVLWPIPGFCLPMELLAFEAIPDLFMKFREPVIGADESCPRMCKSTFKKSENKGFPLSRINEALGRTKDIESILIPDGREDVILHKMTEEDDDADKHDVVVESWMQRFKEGYHVCFEQMFEDDVAARLTEEEEPETPALAALAAVTSETAGLEAGASETPLATQLRELVVLVNTMQKSFEERLQRLEATMVSCEERLQLIEGSMDKGRGKGKKRGRNE